MASTNKNTPAPFPQTYEYYVNSLQAKQPYSYIDEKMVANEWAPRGASFAYTFVEKARITEASVNNALAAQLQSIRFTQDFLEKNASPQELARIADERTRQATVFRKQLLAQIEPEIAFFKDAALKAATQALVQSEAEQKTEAEIIKSLGTDAAKEEVRSALLKAAKENLSLGSAITPSVQAELMKAGIERASATGSRLSSTGIAGAEAGRVLGVTGLQLEQQRQETAAKLFGQVSQLDNQRMQLLGQLFPAFSARRASFAQIAGAATQIANEAVPEVFSGQDAATARMSQLQALAALYRQTGEEVAKAATSKASAVTSVIPSTTTPTPPKDWKPSSSHYVLWGGGER
jgi:hypothetical protein